MKLHDFLSQKRVMPHLRARTREEVVAELVTGSEIQSVTGAVKVLLERESLGSTGIGDGIAFPHGRLNSLGALTGVFGRSVEGVDFGSMDGAPVHLFFLLLAPDRSPGLQLKVLAQMSRLLQKTTVRKELFRANSRETIYAIIAREVDGGP